MILERTPHLSGELSSLKAVPFVPEALDNHSHGAEE